VFNEDAAEEFFKDARAVGIPLMVGLLPFKSAHAAKGIATIPGIRLSPALEEMMQAEDDSDRDLSDFSTELCLSIAERCRPYVQGFHVISGATPKLGLRLVRELTSRWARK